MNDIMSKVYYNCTTDEVGTKRYRRFEGIYMSYHREDGPAVEWADGRKDWYYYGRWINVDNQKDFERYIKLLNFE